MPLYLLLRVPADQFEPAREQTLQRMLGRRSILVTDAIKFSSN